MPNSSGHTTTGPVVLLIDADNLSSPESVGQALLMLIDRVGPVAVRRAYGSPENLKGLAGVMRDLAIRPCVNLPLTKNTTDMALAVDAMDLCQQMAPSVLAIGTGDADFAPLVLRLRERGVRTICFSQGNKMSPEVHGFYDEVVLIGPRSARRGAATRSRTEPARPSATPIPAPPLDADDDADDFGPGFGSPFVQPQPTPAKRAPAKRAARKTPARKTSASEDSAPAVIRQAAKPPEPPLSGDAAMEQKVRQLLEQVPGLAGDKPIEMGDVVKQLRDARLMSKTGNAVKFFKKYAPYLELTPEQQPHKLHWTAARQ